MKIQTLLRRMLAEWLPASLNTPHKLSSSEALHKQPTTCLAADEQASQQLKSALKAQLSGELQNGEDPTVYISSNQDEQLIQHIKQLTRDYNKDNLTRTTAYFDFYWRNPALHWALLAHLVSRNGGWSMTDLQGDPMGRLVRGGDRENYFQFLERCNFLIFGDAFPQLLLWETSVRLGRPLFDWLPKFGVSRGMIPIWKFFWVQEREKPVPVHEAAVHRSLLTHALIANEQNFIEQRVVQQKKYLKTVLHTAQFEAQKWLNLSLVLFPYRNAGTPRCLLAGVVVHDFGSLRARIANGKQLYEILFGYPQVFRAAANWAGTTPHSGSRSDYLPSLFEPKRLQKKPDIRFEDKGCALKPGSQRLASPYLHQAWATVEHDPAEPGDWCKRPEDLLDLLQPDFDLSQEISFAQNNFDITNHYCNGLRRMVLAANIGTVLTET